MLYLLPLLLLFLMCVALSVGWIFALPLVIWAYWKAGQFVVRLFRKVTGSAVRP